MANTVDFNKPLVSVVVPAYNAEAYLGNAFSRLQAQTLHNFEAIFVDDCSKDATTEILKDLVSRDSRFHWVRHEQNQGCGAARNTGIKRATGEYVICLDADDNYYSDLLENMVSALVSTDADIAVCNSVVVNAKTGEKRHFGQWRRLQERMSDDIMVVDHPCKCEDIASLIDYVAWSKMFRRTFFVEKALWFPNLKYYEDIPFSFLSCLLASRLVFLKKPLLEYYIMNTDSMTSWKIPKEFYMVDAFHHVLRRKELLDWKSVESNLMKRILDNIGAVYYSSNTSDEERAAIRTRMSGHVWDMWEVDRLLEQEILGDYGKRLCSEICQLSAPQFSVMLHGDTIGICGMSDPLSEKGYGEIGSLVDRCERLGLHACFTPDLAQGYGVNRLPDPEQKAQWLMELYGQSNISYIFDMSGGNLANEVLPYLSYPLIEKSEKIFIGYSDLTCILNAIYTKTGRPSILYRINNLYKDHSDEQLRRFRVSMMQGKQDLFDFGYSFINGDSMHGVLVGGNLRCLLKLAGTEFWPDMQGKILFIESLNTDLHAIKAAVAQLKQMKVFDDIEGVVIGTFGKEEELGLTQIDQWILTQIPPCLPVAKTKEVGHGYLSKAIWIGKEILLHR